MPMATFAIASPALIPVTVPVSWLRALSFIAVVFLQGRLCVCKAAAHAQTSPPRRRPLGRGTTAAAARRAEGRSLPDRASPSALAGRSAHRSTSSAAPGRRRDRTPYGRTPVADRQEPRTRRPTGAMPRARARRRRLRGRPVLVGLRRLAVLPALEHALFDERLEAIAEDVLGDPGVPLKLGEGGARGGPRASRAKSSALR